MVAYGSIAAYGLICGKEMFDLRHTVCLRRTEFNRWEQVPQPNLRRNEDPNLPVFWSVVARKILTVLGSDGNG